MTTDLVQTLGHLEETRKGAVRRQRASANLEKAGSYQAMALRRQAWTLAQLPYKTMLEDVGTAGDVVPGDPACACCVVNGPRLKQLEKATAAHVWLGELSKAIAQTSKAVNDTMRLQDFLKGLPDSRAETKHVSISAFMALLTDEQFKLFEGWVQAAQARSKGLVSA